MTALAGDKSCGLARAGSGVPLALHAQRPLQLQLPLPLPLQLTLLLT